MAPTARPIGCHSGAKYSNAKDARDCATFLTNRDRRPHIAMSDFGAFTVSGYEVADVSESQGCSVAMGSKPEPTLIEKLLRAIGLVD